MNRRAAAIAWIATMLCASLPGVGWADDAQESYRPQVPVTGEIRLWGSPEDAQLLDALQAAFLTHHRGASFTRRLYGPESTLAGVYTGVADLSFMARELRDPLERMAFEWALLSKPFQVEIAHGGLKVDRPSSTLAVFVHKDNPLQRMTLQQLEALIGAEHPSGWKAQRLRVYGPPIDSIAGLFLRREVMPKSHKWHPDYQELARDEEIVAAVARDPLSIGIAPVRLRNENVKALELGTADAGPFYLPTAATITARTYPLTRSITVAALNTKESPLKPAPREFLRFILSCEGQRIVAQASDYLPLSPESARSQRERLE